MREFNYQSTLPFPTDTVFNWHTRKGAFERLNPPWRPVKILKSADNIKCGAEVKIKLPVLGALGLNWHLRHSAFEPGTLFEDTQISGPFRAWTHRHQFSSTPNNSTLMHDQIRYQLPLLAKPLMPLFERELKRLFTFRHALLGADLTLHQRWHDQPRLTVLIAGASGFVGSALTAFLQSGGHTVIKLVRRAAKGDHERSWDPERGELDPRVFEGIDALINLCGENIAAKRWSDLRKAELISSRVKTSALLASTLASLNNPPKVAIMASGVGYYGDTGSEPADESRSAGTGFLAELAKQWEEAAAPIKATQCRLIHLRISTVLNGGGGALAKMLPIFKLGLGGKLGTGDQLMSWIALEDLLGIILHVLFTKSILGPLNVAAPSPLTNSEFTKALGDILSRPTICPAPSWGLRLALGELADQLLLANCGVVPSALLRSGYRFLTPDIKDALRFEIS